MAVALLDLLNNPTRGAILGNLGKSESSKFLWKNSAAQVRQIYIKLKETITSD
jgi:hypothetical protein